MVDLVGLAATEMVEFLEVYLETKFPDLIASLWSTNHMLGYQGDVLSYGTVRTQFVGIQNIVRDMRFDWHPV